MGHKHSVYDADTHFSINPITRQAKSENNRKTAIIQRDHNSERITFELPRFIEGHDMSICNRVEVHYMNANPITKEQKKGVYEVDDLQISPEDSNVVVCSWLVSQNATQLVGTLSFLVRFACIEKGAITYAWNTAISNIDVSGGIDASEEVVLEYADVLGKWKEELYNAGYINASTMQNNIINLSSSLDVERKRIDLFAALKEGSTTGDAELQDIRVGANGTVYTSAGASVRAQNKTVSNTLTNMAKIFAFSSNGVETKEGFYNTRGEFTSNDSYVSLLLPVTTGDICKLSCRTPASTSFAKCYFFDASRAFVGYMQETSSVVDFIDEIVLVPDGVAYIAITSHSKGVYKLEKAVFLETLADLATPRSLKGKTIVNFGDSIFGNRRPPVDISTMLANLTGATVYNCGFGGCRMARHSLPNFDAFCMYRIADAVSSKDFSVQDAALIDKTASTPLPAYFAETTALLKSIDFSKVDIVTIAYGTNDYMGDVDLEDAADRYATRRFGGALRHSLEKLLTAYPQLKIFLCSQTYRFWMDESGVFIEDSDTRVNSDGVRLTDFVAKTEAVAAEYHIPFINNYHTLGMNRFTRSLFFSATDGTHPLENGCRLIAAHIAKELY